MPVLISKCADNMALSSHRRHKEEPLATFDSLCKHLLIVPAYSALVGIGDAAILTSIRVCVMRFGMLWYDWRTDATRFTTKTPRAKWGDWPRCGTHRKRDGQAAGHGRWLMAA